MFLRVIGTLGLRSRKRRSSVSRKVLLLRKAGEG